MSIHEETVLTMKKIFYIETYNRKKLILKYSITKDFEKFIRTMN